MNKLFLNFTQNAKSLSSFSGLKIFDDLIQNLEFKNLVGVYLPKKERSSGFSSWNKFYALMLGLVFGFDCLDDFDYFGQDVLFNKLTHSPSSVTLGRFLRAFSSRNIEIIQNLLTSFSLTLRSKLEPNFKKIILTMDSSDHEQYGLKSEGVDFGYRKVRSLNSQNLFGYAKGLCYGLKLRSGSTHSVVDGPEMLYNACLNQKCNFAIGLKGNVWSLVLTKNRTHLKWRKTSLKFFESEACEIGSAIYPLKGLADGRSLLRVVFIRAKKVNPTKEDEYPYHYYAVVTDMGESEMSNEHILKFYRKRSQVENNIKDIKNGMDFHHFPCMSLKANILWGVIGVMAYNLMRYASFGVKENGCFVKMTRKRLVTIAGEVISHARSIEIRLMHFALKEVEKIRRKLGFVVDASRLRRGKNSGFKT